MRRNQAHAEILERIFGCPCFGKLLVPAKLVIPEAWSEPEGSMDRASKWRDST